MGLGAWKSFIKVPVRGRQRLTVWSTAVAMVKVALSKGPSSPTPGPSYLGRGVWRLTSATSGGGGPRSHRVLGGCWASGCWCWGAEGGREGALGYQGRKGRLGPGGAGRGGEAWEALSPARGPGVSRRRALTGRDDVPSAEQLQVREDAHEVSHAGVAVDPGPQDAGRALSGALAQPQLGLVAHDQGGCGAGDVRPGLPGPARPPPQSPPARRHPPNWHQSAGSRASITL